MVLKYGITAEEILTSAAARSSPLFCSTTERERERERERRGRRRRKVEGETIADLGRWNERP